MDKIHDPNVELTLPLAESLNRSLSTFFDAKNLKCLEKQIQNPMCFEFNFHVIRTWGFAVLQFYTHFDISSSGKWKVELTIHENI